MFNMILHGISIRIISAFIDRLELCLKEDRIIILPKRFTTKAKVLNVLHNTMQGKKNDLMFHSINV